MLFYCINLVCLGEEFCANNKRREEMKRIYVILKDYSTYYRNTVKLVKGIMTSL